MYEYVLYEDNNKFHAWRADSTPRSGRATQRTTTLLQALVKVSEMATGVGWVLNSMLGETDGIAAADCFRVSPGTFKAAAVGVATGFERGVAGEALCASTEA